jgi:ribose transport system ATP-binding protein
VSEPGQQGVTPPPMSVQLRGVSKTFGAARALDRVDLDLHAGQIHGLLGENGSGKSTLIKILAGFHRPDEGQIIVGGKNVNLPMSPGEYRGLGFAFVHQELGLIPSLSVVENVRLERFAAARSLHISWRRERNLVQELFERFGAPWVQPQATISDLRPVDRALVSIIRALSGLFGDDLSQELSGRLLVLDEPSAFLSQSEVDELFARLRDISARGTSVLLVTHKLHEVLAVTHAVTVLRDGRVIGTRRTDELTENDIARMVLGRVEQRSDADQPAPARGSDRGPALLALQRLRIDGRLDEMDLDVAGGEILGLTGLEGSGFEEVLYALFGLCGYPAFGTVSLAGFSEKLERLTPERAMAMGVALVPGDRGTQGCVTSLSVKENLVAPILERFWAGTHLSWSRINKTARALADQFDIRPREIERDVSTLSGGNQQKVLLAKWLHTEPRVLLLHEPTQGVDIGARSEIFRFIHAATREDNCTLVASTDYDQLEQLCTRVIVIGDRRVTADLRSTEITKARIAEECLLSLRTAAMKQEA